MDVQVLPDSVGYKAVWEVIKSLQRERDYLSRLDAEIGDGDHGINLAKGALIAAKELSTARQIGEVSTAEALECLSSVLSERIGGSMGPIYGELFQGMAVALRGRQMDSTTMDDMLAEAELRVRSLTTAKVGDKSLIDVLVPAVQAFKSSRDQTWEERLVRFEDAAREGLASTRDMPARIGRASRWGDRAVGHLDPGAASCCLVLTTWARTFRDELERQEKHYAAPNE